MEFMFMVMAATVAMIVFMTVFSDLYKDNMNDKKRLLAEDFGYYLQNEFKIASNAKEGYVRNFELPMKLEGYEYGVFVINDTLILNYTQGLLYFPVPSHEGNLAKGVNSIRNVNGSICVNC